MAEWKRAQRKNVARYHGDAASSGRLLVRYRLPGGFNGFHILNCDRDLLSYAPSRIRNHLEMRIHVKYRPFTIYDGNV